MPNNPHPLEVRGWAVKISDYQLRPESFHESHSIVEANAEGWRNVVNKGVPVTVVPVVIREVREEGNGTR